MHAFEQACGVGVEVTTEQIEAAVTATMKTFANELAVQRYSINLTKLMNDVMRQQPWADRGKVKKETELQVNWPAFILSHRSALLSVSANAEARTKNC